MNPPPRNPGADAVDEPLEVLDEEGHVIGIRRREEIHGNPGLAHRAVHVLVFNWRGALYLQKRSASKMVQPGRWDSSAGGHPAPGEGWEEAAIREAAEELGLELRIPGALRFSHAYTWRTGVETEHVRTYAADAEGPFRLDSAEIADGRFWNADELRAAIGTGVLTPNLEKELGYIGITIQPD